MSRIRRIAPGLGRGGLIGNTEGPESYLRELDTLPSQFCRATGGTETVISQGGKFYRVHTFTDTDPTSLLLNFDGANGSTTFTDDSGWGHAVTANGNAAISTTESKFGGSSAYFDGTGDYLSLPSTNNFVLGTGDFTIEFWLYPTSVTSATTAVLSNRYTAGTNDVLVCAFDDATTYGIYLHTQSTAVMNTGVSPTANAWQHIAYVRESGTLYIYKNGTSIGTPTAFTSNLNYSVAPFIGQDGTRSSPAANYAGYIDSLRIVKGQALYTSAFTPSTTALTRVGSGSLTFSRGGAVEYLVVGGGGGGGYTFGGGGGGGGFRTGIASVTSSAQSVFVGSGGAGSTTQSRANSGSASSLLNIAVNGGGGGGSYSNPGNASINDGRSGGSGGGGSAGISPNINGDGGSGNTPTTAPSQGSAGGVGNVGPSTSYGVGGGGGGASSAGTAATTVAGGGGAGSSASISGSSVTYSGGGGGGADSRSGSTSGGAGGAGGGGDGGNGVSSQTTGENGTANTGGGGGGGAYLASPATEGSGGSGGSGIVIARYRITQAEYEAEAA